MFISAVDKVLDPSRLAKISELIAAAPFVDGRISGGTEQQKRNLELNPQSERYVELLNLIEIAIRENLEFLHTAFPRYITRPIISRYDVGMYYKEHVDSAVMNFPPSRDLRPFGMNFVRSDLSMTVFLSKLDSYDGGELCIEGPLEPLRLRRDAGNAIVYPTGSRHSVAPVTRGVRLAAVVWIQTMFPIEAQRKAVCDARRLMKILGTNPKSPEFAIAEESFLNLWRLFATV